MIEQFRYIVIEGPIGVGKTSLANKLADEFETELLLEKPEENPFLASFYQNPKQYALSAQLHFLLQRAQQVQDFRQTDMFRDSCIADFMVDKDRLFAQMTLDKDELALYEQIYTHLTLDAPRPDLVIYLQAPLETLRQRITQRGIGYEQQIRDDYLLRLVRLQTIDERRPVLFGAIGIRLEAFTREVRDLVAEGQEPLGGILQDFKVPHYSDPRSYFAVDADDIISDALREPPGVELYGRCNELSDEDGIVFADIVEILPANGGTSVVFES